MSGPDLPDNPSRDDLERLSRWAGVKLETLVALSHNVDPFLAGTPTHVAEATAFARLIDRREPGHAPARPQLPPRPTAVVRVHRHGARVEVVAEGVPPCP